MADLLLRESEDAERRGRPVDDYLREAQATVELLKAAQLEDYFRDDCVRQVRSAAKPVTDVDDRGSAVVYVIPLPDRVELLVSIGPRRWRVPVRDANARTLDEAALRFRRELTDATTNRYRAAGGQLYRWLIEPVEPILTEQKIDTLVFVPDGALRAVPMAALWNPTARRFLVTEYAVAVTPGLDLLAPARIDRANLTVLAAGFEKSDHHKDAAALPFARQEVDDVARLFGARGRRLLDGAFLSRAVEEELGQEPYTIVHVASHGEFVEDAAQSHILTWDGQLKLDDLQRIIQPNLFKRRPVELLTLSACRTAAGNDRAALGLAGVAVKAGARSALATLWHIDDRATSELAVSFYRHLRESDLSKAKALQAAQRELIVQYDHPRYWSAFIIIGNWL